MRCLSRTFVHELDKEICPYLSQFYYEDLFLDVPKNNLKTTKKLYINLENSTFVCVLDDTLVLNHTNVNFIYGGGGNYRDIKR